MGVSVDDDEMELRKPPRFEPGEKVRSTRLVRNDGTFPGREVGEVLVKKGDVGYVRDVGTFLQRFYIYAVEFVDRGAVVGMKGRELARVPEPGAVR
jgi:nitrogen fixation protein NifZ